MIIGEFGSSSLDFTAYDPKLRDRSDGSLTLRATSIAVQ